MVRGGYTPETTARSPDSILDDRIVMASSYDREKRPSPASGDNWDEEMIMEKGVTKEPRRMQFARSSKGFCRAARATEGGGGEVEWGVDRLDEVMRQGIKALRQQGVNM
jgi:hypothetical protein